MALKHMKTVELGRIPLLEKHVLKPSSVSEVMKGMNKVSRPKQ